MAWNPDFQQWTVSPTPGAAPSASEPTWTIPGFVAIPFDQIGIQSDPLDIFADGFETGDTEHWSAVAS